MKYILTALISIGLMMVGVEFASARTTQGQEVYQSQGVLQTATKKKTKKAKKAKKSKLAKK